MKQQANNEIDLLLRRLSRRDGGSARGGEAYAEGQHLDADELSAYAQNALPVSTRARYTEHLADCSTCRKLVTELSLSLGAATVAAPVETVKEPGGLKKFLASLFSPLVLRYAVPALGVFMVMVVGFVVLRQQRRNEFVAQVYDNQKQSEPLTKQPETPAAAPLPSESPNNNTQTKIARDQGRVERPAEPKPESKAGETAGAAAPAPATKDEKSADDRVAVAPSPTAPAASKAAATADTEEQKKADVIAKNQPEPQVQRAKVSEQEAKAPTARDAVRPGVSPLASARVEQSKEKAEPSPSVGFIGGGARTAAKARRQEVRNEETRTSEGRRFRKEGGIWIDTAYDSSTATVNVARDSEQFRALVADEPAIDTIAKQLDGEIIVVWKGRAYRIR